MEDLSTVLFSAIGSEPSDWDFTERSGALDKSKRIVLPHTLVLDRIRSPFNVGSIFRTADSFGIKEILMVEGTADVSHPRCLRTARGTVDTVDHRVLSEESLVSLLQGKPCFALELGGTVLSSFQFPEEGVCVIGSEEMGICPALLSLCDRSLGRVSIEMYGTKGSLNVSVATGIMLYRWH
jgi:TrmH family RNA methyltransferase